MAKIRLYIENYEIDLQDETQVVITRQLEELYNPTILCNDYSKTVKIPMTARNNRIFGMIYKPDFITAQGGSEDVGIYFDPYKKLDFKLEWNEDVVMQGYAKMLTSKKTAGTGFYEVTLNGELGKVFQELKKITFDPSESGTTYFLDGSQYVNSNITKELVKMCWSHGQTIQNIDNPNLHIYDVINFAPCNCYDEDFEYDSFQYVNNQQKKFKDILEDIDFSGSTGVDPDVAIPDGLKPREIGEYRSYLQQPYIYFNKLFQIFQAKAESITDYTFDLDSDWFNTGNTYWYRLVMLMKKLDVANGNSYNNIYSGIKNGSSTQFMYWNPDDTYDSQYTGSIYITSAVTEQKPVTVNNGRITINNPMALGLNLNTSFMTGVAGKTINNTNALLLTMVASGANGYVEEQTAMLVGAGYTGDTSGNTVVTVGDTTSTTLDVPTIRYYFTVDDRFGSYVDLKWKLKWKLDEYPFTQPNTKVTFYYDIYPSASTADLKINGEHWARSGGAFTLNDLWNNEYNLFDVILNYCKMYRIFIIVDKLNKKLKFIPSHKYFQDYQIYDWSDKICYDKEFVVKPVSWDSKYVLFNYKDAETTIGEKYKEEQGFDFGEKRVITEYNFDTNSTDLFKNTPLPSITYTPNVLSWTNLYNNKKIEYSLPAEIYVDMAKDDKYTDQFGTFYFFRGISYFDTEEKLNLRSIKITDDTALQNVTNTYFYSQDQNGVDSATYPKLDIIDQYGKMCIFAVPMENYTYLGNAYDGATDIYTNVWKKYIDERYNRNNKLVTAYVYFYTPNDYTNLEFNHFVMINNQLYIINKIYDYDVAANQKTKMDLITIQNITGYTER